MSNLLYISGNFSLFGQSVFAFSAGGIIHVLLVIAIIQYYTINQGKDYKISILVKIKKI
jgi:hypothetical protein